MGCGPSSDAAGGSTKDSGEKTEPFSNLRGNPERGSNPTKTPIVVESKESHTAPKKEHAPTTKEKNTEKDPKASAGATNNGTPHSALVTTLFFLVENDPNASAGATHNGTLTSTNQSAPAAPHVQAVPVDPVAESTCTPPKTAQTEQQKEDYPKASAGATDNGTLTSTNQSAPAAPHVQAVPVDPVAEFTCTPPKTALTEQQKEDRKRRMMKKIKDRNKSVKKTEEMVIETMKKAVEKRGVLREESDTAKKALIGDIDMACPPPAKVVRIFTSSTFTDTKNERNMLMKHAYPKVKEHCRRIGYEFQVVDMRWGVRDEATDDHMTTELCMKELKLCQEVSTGPNFVFMLSHKYGYTPFPRVIEAGEFETIMAGMEDEESKQLFQRWYTLDNNAVPPAYTLSPISSRLPDFTSPDQEKKKQAKQSWWDESEKMQYALDVTATQLFDEERARKYIMSVTETEVTEGILMSDNPSKHTVWFRRDIENIEELESSYLLSRYIECTGPEEKWQKSRTLLKELKENKIAKKLSADRIIPYTVKWNQTTGINPEEDKHHKDYLDTLCVDFVAKLTDMIDAGVAERARSDDHLVEECCQHIRFCQSKCEGFQGRQDTLEMIKAYVRSTSSEPLVLHGTSGTGKTSIMAMAAKMMKQWTYDPPAVVLRFLGTSPDSSSMMPLLESLTSQIRRIYKLSPLSTTAPNIDTRIREFEEALQLGQPDKPVILMLDSLDQLDPAYDARKLGWLIMKLAPGTKVIVSTLPEPIYESFPALQAGLKSESSFVGVPVLDNSDVKTILDSWLTMRQRRLSDHQMTTVLDAFKKCPTPLFLKLSFEEAVTWSSFVPADTTVLQDTVRASIDFLFQKLEKKHGLLLVSRALGYLTIANSGTTEAELEDILSCDDDVLNDVYMYWTPPIRRLPPLLLVRVRADLNQYIVERGADGVRVIYWYHRQFIEAAEERYCSDKATNMMIHERLADFFNGTWAAGKKKSYTNAKGESGEEDRHVSSQPLKFGPDNYNLRTLNDLPYHCTKAGQVELLKDQCLANPTFLIHKLEAAPFYSVLRDYAMAREMFPDDDLIKEVLQALNLSEKALTTDAKQVVPQLLQRLEESSATHQLLERLRAYPSTYILPTKCVLERPGGQLVHSISAHRQRINMMDVTIDGKLVVTSCDMDETVKIWDIGGAVKKREVRGLETCDRAFFCNHDKWLACGLPQKLVIQTVDTGANVMTLPGVDQTICLFGKGRTFIMQLMGEQYRLTNLLADPSEAQMPLQSHPEHLKLATCNLLYGRDHLFLGSDNYLAVTSRDRYFITVYDLSAKSFRPSFRGVPLDDEDDPQEGGVEVIGPVISRDETHLIYSEHSNKEVVFADFDGNRLRSIQCISTEPTESSRYGSLNLTQDGHLLYIIDDLILRFFDCRTLQNPWAKCSFFTKLDHLNHGCYGYLMPHRHGIFTEVGTIETTRYLAMAVSHDGVNVITISDDGNLRIWDRSRKDESKGDVSSQSMTDLAYLDSTHDLSNPRYKLLCGSMEDDEYETPNLHLLVYDVFTKTMVTHGAMTGRTEEELFLTCETVLKTKNELQVILVMCDGQIVRVDLQTMTVVENYLGFTTMVVMSEETEEIFCTTRGAMHMKLYDENGDFVTVMKVGQKQRITQIQINSMGTIGCAKGDEGPIMLYDITNRQHLYNIDPGNWKRWRAVYGGNARQMFDYFLIFNKAGTRLFFNSDSKIDGIPVIDDINHMVMWDIQARKEVCRLYDAESQALYAANESGMDVGLCAMHELDDTRLISTHTPETILRVWNIQTGEMLAQMPGHASYAHLKLCEKCPYILSYGSFDIEGCVKLWAKATYECVANFTLDTMVSNIKWSVDGKFLTSDPPDFTVWKIYHGHDHMTVNETDYPQTFSQKGETTGSMDVELYKHMERDPDTDPENEDDSDREENYDDD